MIVDYSNLLAEVKREALKLGFQQLEVTDTNLSKYTPQYRSWLAKQFHGEMSYLERNISLRENPARLQAGTIRVLVARMDYAPTDAPRYLNDPSHAYIARYSLGRDYHRVIRQRLRQLAEYITNQAGGSYRAFTDSAPILEKPLAEKAGLGWQGKNTLILNKESGSFFFLGEIFTDLPFPTSDESTEDLCGKCKACITVCPTNAIVAPNVLDARRCISYLTIEHRSAIPLEFRKAIGNRVFGCDDCQTCCPWNRFAKKTEVPDFNVRHDLDCAKIVDLLRWDEADFLARTEGMAIRRINYPLWVRNLAIAAGNAIASDELIRLLNAKRAEPSIKTNAMVLEHIDWAMNELQTDVVS